MMQECSIKGSLALKKVKISYFPSKNGQLLCIQNMPKIRKSRYLSSNFMYNIGLKHKFSRGARSALKTLKKVLYQKISFCVMIPFWDFEVPASKAQIMDPTGPKIFNRPSVRKFFAIRPPPEKLAENLEGDRKITGTTLI